MSLKTFHIVFISISALFAFGFGVWLFQSYSGTQEIPTLIGAFASFLSGAGLIVYGVKFLKKLQNVSFL